MGLEDFLRTRMDTVGTNDPKHSSEDVGFKLKLDSWVSLVVKEHQHRGTSLNESIANIVRRNNLNNDQMQRVVEEVNNQVYLAEYKKLSNKTVRDVQFDIADGQKIKDMLSPDVPINQSTTTNPELITEDSGNMQKAASSNTGLYRLKHDEISYLNGPLYKTADVGHTTADKGAKERILSMKIAEEIAAFDADYEKLASSCKEDLDDLAEAIFKIARFDGNPQPVFEKIAKMAKLDKTTQIIVKEAYAHNVQSLKKIRKLATTFEENLNLVDALKGESKPFSLGEHSLIKTAEEDKTPNVIVNKRLVNNYGNLAELAIKVQKQQEALNKKSVDKVKIDQLKQKVAF